MNAAPAAQAATAGAVISSAQGDGLVGPLREGRLGDFQARSAFAACLLPLLNALGWRRGLREISESLPHFADTLDFTDLTNVLSRLGFDTQKITADSESLDQRLLPCLFVSEDDSAHVLIERHEDGYKIFDGLIQEEREALHSELRGHYYLVSRRGENRVDDRFKAQNWLGTLTRRFRGLFVTLAGMTLFLNVLALLVPLFIMTVYDQVIPTHSRNVLAFLAGGMALALIIEAGARLLRARVIAYLGGRVEYLVATSALEKLLALPTNMTETVSIGKQVARLKEFDAIREMFTGPLVSVVLEMPFIVIFLVVIWALAGPLWLIPVTMMGVFALIAVILVPRLRRAVATSGTARAGRHGFLVETVSNMRTIRETNAGATWLERYRGLSAEACYSHFKASQITSMFQTLSQAIMMIAGMATITFGVYEILNNNLTIGALIATMALVWRVLAPMNSLFLTLSRFEQIRISLRQVNQLMRMPIEKTERAARATRRELRGAIGFSRTSFRYSAEAEPALLGVSFVVKPGEMLAITGASGAGKTTLLRLMLGLNAPQAGQVSISGLDIRQLDPSEIRQSIAYVPQTTSLFHGTVAQNLRLANPSATDGELVEACHMAGVMAEVDALKSGLGTRLGDHNTHHLNSGFRQRLSLARAYVQKAPIILLDEAAQRLDEAGDDAFVKTLEKLKGTATIVMVSHRPSHMRLADKLIVMNRGQLVLGGTPDEVIPKLFEKKS